jgi:hypothetical protein
MPTMCDEGVLATWENPSRCWRTGPGLALSHPPYEGMDTALSSLQWVGGTAHVLQCPWEAWWGLCVVVMAESNARNRQQPWHVDGWG